MFVRVRKLPGKKKPLHYAYLVDNQWNPFQKKHEQKILMSLGRVEDLPVDGTIEKAITALDKFASKMGFSSLSNGVVLSDLTSETLFSKTYEYGSMLVTRHLLEKLSFTKILTSAWLESKRQQSGKRKTPTETGKATPGGTKKGAPPFLSLQKFLTTSLALVAYRLYSKTAASDLETYRWYEQDVFFGSRRQEKKELALQGEMEQKQHKKTTDNVTLNKDDFYMSLDILLENKNAIEAAYYEQNKDLFTEGLDLVLFDTTTIYYYGAEGPARETDLLQYNGHNKDGKNNEKQILVGVLMTKSGVPVAHEVLPGNTADVRSFAKIMSIIKHKYHLKQVILIADRGMISEENLLHLEQMEYSYLVGVRMRKLPEVLQKKLLEPMDPEDETADMEPVFQAQRIGSKPKPTLYTKTGTLRNFSDEEMDNLFIKKILKKKISTFDKTKLLELLRRRRYFVCYNPAVAKDTKEKRKYFKAVLKKKIMNTPTKDWIIKNGYKKYLTFPDGIHPALDEERLTDEALFDGKWVLITNDRNMSAKAAILYYKTLQQIERGFRDLKSLITVRPIFHWKEDRIKAHIFVCFLSLIMKWYICRILDKDSQEAGRRFIEEMINLKAISIDETMPLFVRTALTPEVQTQMKTLGMRIPGKILLDGRRKANTVNPKGGRPRNVNPDQYSIPFLEAKESSDKQK